MSPSSCQQTSMEHSHSGSLHPMFCPAYNRSDRHLLQIVEIPVCKYEIDTGMIQTHKLITMALQVDCMAFEPSINATPSLEDDCCLAQKLLMFTPSTGFLSPSIAERISHFVAAWIGALHAAGGAGLFYNVHTAQFDSLPKNPPGYFRTHIG